MKKIFFKMILLSCLTFLMFDLTAQNKTKERKGDCERELSQDSLPQDVKNFIVKYFPNEMIRKVERGRHCGYYEVKFDSKLELKIMGDGNWLEIEADDDKDIDMSYLKFLPSSILQTLKSKYSDMKIKEVSRERYGYEVEFKSMFEKREIYFDKSGNQITKDQKDQLMKMKKEKNKPRY